MRLVITEKPSVAKAIAKVIGATEKKDGYLEGNGYLVSWCVGHLIELASPESYYEQWKRWSYETLPLVPVEWQYIVKQETAAQFKVIKKLLHEKSVESIVCATDAGREYG